MLLSTNVNEDSYLKCSTFGTLHCFQSWTCPSPRSCDSRWGGCYRPGQAMLLSVIIAAFSLSQAHHAVPGPGSVPATGAVVHAWSHCYIAAFSLSQSQDAIPGQSVPAQELWFTFGITATLLLSPFLRHTTLFLVLSQPQTVSYTHLTLPTIVGV